MKRRDFSLAGGVALAAGALVLPAARAQTTTPAQVQGKAPQAGEDYLALDKRVPVDAPAGKIEVIEFFWYSCPHCNSFEPALDAWIKRAPKDLVVRRVPVAFRDDFVPQQRLFYALEAMGLVDQLHRKVFTAIHVEKQDLARADAIANWVAKQGVDKAKFLEHYNSFSVATKATRGTQLQNAYKVEGVPALGVAGRFYTDGTLAKNMDRALQIVDFLAAGIRSGR
ncbi:thiol:disulfide interchange protein DsbA/DsbL [Rhodoferax sp.]|uniref:thiol:disulfide interchange protein DsbA/DsbL n=1 Tax=Rhodoferax sp. TaxID=50421 RepID=UPI002720C5B2|nr:thiol:disulfide interchange protein DsbA/DsbL [Rhodoferax sp.]MDO9199009.1 thiol:disulfide interchange protein DsbA/DsbL [Rhodoferax sp.]